MQPQDDLSVSRRSLDFDDYIDIVRRHKSWILGPAFLALVVAVVVAFLWPDTYVSTAVIRVVPPQVPQRLVPTNVNMELSQRVNSMAQTILSRANLSNIIQTYGLYPRQRQRVPLEDIIEEMRLKDIRLSPVVSMAAQNRGAVSAFQISFAYENRYLAQKVTQDLVARFINESITQSANVSVMTTEFLKDQLDAARAELDDYERKLTAFRMSNTGRLPEQFQANLQQLNAVTSRVGTINASISRINQEKLMIEAQLRVSREQLAALESSAQSPAAQAKTQELVQLEREIQRMETSISALRDRYKDTHPDVQRALDQLNAVKRSRDTIAEQEATERAAAVRASALSAAAAREIRDLQGVITRLETAIRAKDLELEEHNKELARAEKAIKSYELRIESSPIGEQQYAELVRDRNLARAKYEELKVKQSQSAIATDLENRKQGETLELLDPASIPQTPSEPKRWMIILMGLATGLLLGGVLVGMREMKDTSLKNLKDVRAYTNLMILGSVPLLENDLVVRRRRRLAWLSWSTAVMIGLAVMSGSVYYYYYYSKGV